ncbi:enoyl-CoA hydratase/isomerase family protein [Bradyrhizobium sp. AUGA SZCCT0182]|nr:enoyl-CoA hydratase/isomerase family protein [Bradyrhizobium sp. AUGA SZCCT0182]
MARAVYHLAIERLTSIDAPVVAAVRGGAGGGGLGLMYVADIVVAAEDARFALGYGALGLTADGGNTWFLPRMVGMRRAQEALAFGLVSRLRPSDAVERSGCHRRHACRGADPRLRRRPPHAAAVIRDGVVRSARRREGIDRGSQRHRRRAGGSRRLCRQAPPAVPRRMSGAIGRQHTSPLTAAPFRSACSYWML